MNDKNLVTGLYVTSNRENQGFEQKIREDILNKKGDMPIISVSQKPIDFGTNICIGDVGTSGFNFVAQLRIACKNAKTKFVLALESDCLYAPDYFKFIPPHKDGVWRNTNNYVLVHGENMFYPKDSQTAFQVAGRDFLLDRLNFLLKDQPEWSTDMQNFPKEIGQPFLEGWNTFKTEFACFGIKTGEGMRVQTRHGKEGLTELPYWGTAKKIKETYLCQT